MAIRPKNNNNKSKNQMNIHTNFFDACILFCINPPNTLTKKMNWENKNSKSEFEHS